MNEILFRCYDKIDKKYKELLSISFQEKTAVLKTDCRFFELSNARQAGGIVKNFDDVIFEQFTGLYDNTKWEQLTEKGQSDFWQSVRSDDGINIRIQKEKAHEYWKGRRIFEGDIVKCGNEKVGYQKGKIIFEDCCFKWVDLINRLKANPALMTYEIEVVGNIHDEELV